MIILLEPDCSPDAVTQIKRTAGAFPEVKVQTRAIKGERLTVTEVYLIGQTGDVPVDAFTAIPGVQSVTRVTKKYRMIGRHHDVGRDEVGFEYNGVRFREDAFLLFAGLCAVDRPEHVDEVMAACAAHGLTTTRMGAYKPRTSPYDFQGLGKDCLPWVFELAGKHGIKVIAMEVTSPRHVEEIHAALDASGAATGVLLQIGTRNAQNFELLKEVGQQRRFPVLYKRGLGVSLEESLNAAEYIASEGNPNIVFCLRGVKSHLGDPHRNLVDFAHVPVLRRLTRLLVCVDPSHSVGRAFKSPDGLPDILHSLGQGVIAGANLGLVDLHPRPNLALCDGPQALTLEELPLLHAYVQRVRRAYEDVTALVSPRGSSTQREPANTPA